MGRWIPFVTLILVACSSDEAPAIQRAGVLQDSGAGGATSAGGVAANGGAGATAGATASGGTCACGGGTAGVGGSGGTTIHDAGQGGTQTTVRDGAAVDGSTGGVADAGVIDAATGGAGGARTTDAAPCTTAGMYVLVDRSTSMACSLDSGGTRWTMLTSQMQPFLGEVTYNTVQIGIGFFGTAEWPTESSCDPQAYGASVPIDDAVRSTPDIRSQLNAHQPITDTPTVPALQGAIAYATSWKAQKGGQPVAVVLITDGLPNACGATTMDDVTGTASNGLANAGVRTFVIGLVSPGAPCSFDPNPATVADFDKVAKAGGTAKTLVVDTTVVSAGVLDALRSVKSQLLVECGRAGSP